MTDQELLEQAAKAVGRDLAGWEWGDTPFFTGFVQRNFEDGFELQAQFWNPLESNGEALCLAADCNLVVGFLRDAVAVSRTDGSIHYQHEPYNGNKMYAARRAIVRAAAAMASCANPPAAGSCSAASASNPDDPSQGQPAGSDSPARKA